MDYNFLCTMTIWHWVFCFWCMANTDA